MLRKIKILQIDINKVFDHYLPTPPHTHIHTHTQESPHSQNTYSLLNRDNYHRKLGIHSFGSFSVIFAYIHVPRKIIIVYGKEGKVLKDFQPG